MLRRVLQIRNDFEEFARARREVTGLLEAKGLNPEFVRTVNLGLEEVVTNILEYGYDDEGEHQIKIALLLTPSELEMVVEDDGHEFNPLHQPEPDRGKPLEEREPGGLGISFVRQFFDEVQYEREAENNFLILRKKLPEAIC